MVRGDNKIMGFALRSVQDLVLQTIAGFCVCCSDRRNADCGPGTRIAAPERGLRPRNADCGWNSSRRIFRDQGNSLITAIWRVIARVMIRHRRRFVITEYDAEGHPHRSLRDLAAVHDHGK
jgi:hypothetical protein